MTKRSVTIAVAFAATFAFSASAFARPKPIPQRQAKVRKALSGLKINVKSERFVTNKKGRQDLVLASRTPHKKVGAEFKRAYLQDLNLAEGYKAVGWAYMPYRDSYTVTLRKGDERIIAEVQQDGAGSSIAIWGYVRNPTKAPRSPSRAVPGPKPTVSR